MRLRASLGVTQKTAWFMLHRIRLAMLTKIVLMMGGAGGGPVEVDEAYIGGKPTEHAQGKRKHRRKYWRCGTGQIEDMKAAERSSSWECSTARVGKSARR